MESVRLLINCVFHPQSVNSLFVAVCYVGMKILDHNIVTGMITVKSIMKEIESVRLSSCQHHLS